jgi:hypothetical protein
MRNSEDRSTGHSVLGAICWLSNFLPIVTLLASVGSGIWEFSVPKYLLGFSAASVPKAATAVQQVRSILSWMQMEAPRLELNQPNFARATLAFFTSPEIK